MGSSSWPATAIRCAAVVAIAGISVAIILRKRKRHARKLEAQQLIHAYTHPTCGMVDVAFGDTRAAAATVTAALRVMTLCTRLYVRLIDPPEGPKSLAGFERVMAEVYSAGALANADCDVRVLLLASECTTPELEVYLGYGEDGAAATAAELSATRVSACGRDRVIEFHTRQHHPTFH